MRLPPTPCRVCFRPCVFNTFSHFWQKLSNKVSRRSGARSCHGSCPGGGGCVRSAGGRAAVCGAPAGRVPKLWGVFIIAVHSAFVLGLGGRQRDIVKLSEGG